MNNSCGLHKKRVGSLRENPKWSSIREKFEASQCHSDDEGSFRKTNCDCPPPTGQATVSKTTFYPSGSLSELPLGGPGKVSVQRRASDSAPRARLTAIQALSSNRRRVYSEHVLRLDKEARLLSRLSSKKLAEIANAKNLCSATRNAIEASRTSLSNYATITSSSDSVRTKTLLNRHIKNSFRSKLQHTHTATADQRLASSLSKMRLVGTESLDKSNSIKSTESDDEDYEERLRKLSVKEKVKWLETIVNDCTAKVNVKKSTSASEITPHHPRMTSARKVSYPAEHSHSPGHRCPQRSTSMPVPRQRQVHSSNSSEAIRLINGGEEFCNYSNKDICLKISSVTTIIPRKTEFKPVKLPIPNPRTLLSSALDARSSDGGAQSGSDLEQLDYYNDSDNIYETLPFNMSKDGPTLKRSSLGRSSLESASLSEESHWPDSSDSGSYSSNQYDAGVIKRTSPCPPPLPPRIAMRKGDRQAKLFDLSEKSEEERKNLLREAAPAIIDAYETITEKIGDLDSAEHIYQGIYEFLQMPETKEATKTHSYDEATLLNLIQVIEEIQATVSSSASSSVDTVETVKASKSKQKEGWRVSVFGRKKKPSKSADDGNTSEIMATDSATEQGKSPISSSSSRDSTPLPSEDTPRARLEQEEEDHSESVYANFATSAAKESKLAHRQQSTNSLLESIISSSDNKLKQFFAVGPLEPSRPSSLDLKDCNRISTASSGAYVVPSEVYQRANINDLERDLLQPYKPWSSIRSLNVKRTDSDRSGYIEFKSLDVSPFEDEPLYQFYDRDVKMREWINSGTVVSGGEGDDEIYGECGDSLYCELKELTSAKANHDEDGPGSISKEMQTSAMELVSGGSRRLWCEVPQVRESGLLDKLDVQQRKVQEAIFEVISSEASYLKSLQVLVDHFENHADFLNSTILNSVEKQDLFSNIDAVKAVTERFFGELDQRWQQNILMSNICDIIYDYAASHFDPYVQYCQYQIKQERTLKKLKATRPQFAETLKLIELSTKCQGLSINSFILLPMQRVTRYPLLVDAILKRLDTDSPEYEICKNCLIAITKLVRGCNDAAKKYECWNEMVELDRKLRFDNVKSCPIVSSSRWLLKKGEATRLVMEYPSSRTFTLSKNPRWSKSQNFLFLFNDLLIISKKKSDDYFSVLDYCDRNLVQVTSIDEEAGSAELPPSCFKYRVRLDILQTQNKKNSCCFYNFPSENDRQRWVNAILPPQSTNPDEKLYDEWDCPQVICIRTYNALQPDELSLHEADSVNVFKKLNDWYEGERIRDGARGWFPADVTEEIPNRHVRARNVRLRHRLMVLTGSYLQQHITP